MKSEETRKGRRRRTGIGEREGRGSGRDNIKRELRVLTHGNIASKSNNNNNNYHNCRHVTVAESWSLTWLMIDLS